MNTAFVLSGGGAKGSWQAGVLKALTEAGVVPDAAVGTSVGALNAAGLCLNGIDDLLAVWRAIGGNRDVQRLALWKLFWASGVYHFGPLRKLLDKHLSHDMGGPAAYASFLDTKSGMVNYLSQYDARDRDEFIDAILGSSSVGFFHEPIRGSWIDGGHREVVPIHFAYHQLRAGRIYAIGTMPLHAPLEEYSPPGFLPLAANGLRSVDCMTKEIYTNDLRPYIRDKSVTIITPDEPLPIGDMEYNPVKIEQMIEKGYQDGRKACS